jgi:hypothetical protein
LRSIAKNLATTTPCLLEAALGFDKFVGFIDSLLHEMTKVFVELTSTLAKLWEVQSKCERLECSLQRYIDMEEENAKKYLSQIQTLQKKLEEAE